MQEAFDSINWEAPPPKGPGIFWGQRRFPNNQLSGDYETAERTDDANGRRGALRIASICVFQPGIRHASGDSPKLHNILLRISPLPNTQLGEAGRNKNTVRT